MNNQLSNKGKELIKIAVPAILESMVMVVVTAIDTKMVSVLGKPTVSAISLTSQPKLIIMAIFFALGTALSFFVAQAYGRQDKDEANKYFHSILKIGVVISIVFGILTFTFAEPIMRFCSRQTETLDISVSFFRIVAGFLFFNAVLIILNSALRGIGLTRITFVSSIATAVVDIAFNYLLIEGHMGFPALGVVGDAISTVLGTMAGCVISLIVILKHSEFISLRGFLSPSSFSDHNINRNIRVKATSVVMENILIRIGFLVLNFLVSTFSPEQTAVYGVSMILMGYTFAFGDGLSAATIALCGKSVGAEDRNSFRDYKYLATGMGIVLAVLLSVAYIFGAKWFYSLYFVDEPALRQGLRTNFIISAITLFQILRIVDVGAMRGMGEVNDPRRIATICVLIVNPLLGYLFAEVFEMEIYGLWASTLSTHILWFILSHLRYRHHLNKLLAPKSEAAGQA